MNFYGRKIKVNGNILWGWIESWGFCNENNLLGIFY